MLKILSEDKAMVDRLRPEAIVDKELSLRPDAPQTAFRALRRRWAAAGFVAPAEAPGGARARRGLLDGGE